MESGAFSTRQEPLFPFFPFPPWFPPFCPLARAAPEHARHDNPSSPLKRSPRNLLHRELCDLIMTEFDKIDFQKMTALMNKLASGRLPQPRQIYRRSFSCREGAWASQSVKRGQVGCYSNRGLFCSPKSASITPPYVT